MSPTIGRDSEWAAVLRGERPSRIVTCEACGGRRMALGGPHAPRWLGGRLVDCAGRGVAP